MIALCTLGCDRKAGDIHSWESLFGLDGDYHLYFNYETGNRQRAIDHVQRMDGGLNTRKLPVSLDVWNWNTAYGTEWRKLPKFDQDQARLASIVTARSMCIEFAMQINATHLLFVDADIVPPKDTITKLLQVGKPAVAGLVHGRGVHKGCKYIFQEKRRWVENGYELVEAEHANIGFTMIERKLFEEVRFRYGTSKYPDGSVRMISDDPAFHLDVFTKFGHWMVIRTDVVGNHVGDLKYSDVAQY